MASTESKRVPIPKNGVDYRGKVVLAPMVRSGELPSRLLALKYGADLVWGPETIDRAMIGTTRRINPHTNTIEFTRMSSSKLQNPEQYLNQRESVIYRIHPELEKGRLIYQIGTADPDLAVEASKMVAEDVAGIDVNAGCPKPFSTAGGMGAALLKTPDLLCAILRKLVREIGEVYGIGISVKIRLFDEARDTEALVRKLVQTGITGLTIHCRTTPMRPRERAIRAQLKMVGEVCREAGVACVMNGDVISRKQAFELMKEYNVDGAMIATEAEKNPGCFRPEAEGGPHEWKAQWKTNVADYMHFALAVENRWGNTKFLLAQMIPGKDKTFGRMNAAKCYADVVRALELDGVEGMLERANAVDKRVGLPPPEMTSAKKAKMKGAVKAVAAKEETAKQQAAQAEALETFKTEKRKSEEEESAAKRVKLPETSAEDRIETSTEALIVPESVAPPAAVST